MSADEFSLIRQYFSDVGTTPPHLLIGIGDDAAILNTTPGYQLVVCMDTLIEGVHFPTGTAASDLAVKSLAVNLSDLAAMGAKPAWFQLSLTLPVADESWLAEFSAALKETADRYQIGLVGGDTCRGPLSITIQAAGLVTEDNYVTRSNAKSGDLIVVSGRLGDAALGLAGLQKKVTLSEALSHECRFRLNRPQPRLELTDFLRNYASSAIDISDGLVADLGHILEQSKVGAKLEQNLLPVNGWIKDQGQYHYALYGGDDYEICFTMPGDHLSQLEDWNSKNPECPLSVIGESVASGYTLDTGEGMKDLSADRGFKHFG